jgi:SWIM zinc finger
VKMRAMRCLSDNASFRVKGSGGQTYDTELYFEDVGLHLDCTCPHAQDGAFCKHMVAAALVWRKQLGGDDSEQNQPLAGKKSAPSATDSIAKSAQSPAQKRAATAADKRAALAQFLAIQPAGVLAERLLAAGEEDRALMTQLKSWHAQHLAALAPASKAKVKAWKEVLTELLKKRSDFYHWKNLGGYIRGADEAVNLLRDIAKNDVLQAREACFFAMRKLYAVGMHTDDSSGMLGDVMRNVEDVINQTLKKQPPLGKDAAAFGEAWHKLMTEDPWGIWTEETTLAAAGADVQAWANKKAAKDWQDWLTRAAAHDQAMATSLAQMDALKAKPKKTPEDRRAVTKAEREHSERFGSYANEVMSVRHDRWLLHSRYLKALERQEDIPGLYAFHQQCTQPQAHAEAYDWIRLIEWCNAHSREREMLQWTRAGLKAFPDDWRLKDLLLQCYERDGYEQEAFDIRLARVKDAPNVENYALALKSAKQAGKDVAQCRAALFDWAKEQETLRMQKPSLRFGWGHNAADHANLRDVSTRVAWLLCEKRVGEALALAQTADVIVSHELLDALAKAIQAEQPLVAGKLLLRIFDAKMPRASTPYDEELSLVKRIVPLLAQDERKPWLALLRAQWRAKRNFIAGLDKIEAH